jgi:oligopeptide transport system substrate-binding protein
VFGIVPRESVEAPPPAPPFSDEPISSGPFTLRRHDEDVISLISARPNMRLAGMELVQYPDVESAYEAFTEGELDLARVPSEDIAAAGERYGRAGFRPYLGELFYGFNLRSPKFADPRFREAIVRAIDRRAIVSAIYQGTARPLDGPVLEGAAGHQPDPCSRCRHDPERARALVREVFGARPVPEVGVDYDDDEVQAAIARAIQAGLQQVGIPAALRPRPLREYNDFALSGPQELFRLGWVAAYPSADAVLPQLFATDSDNNLVGMSNPAIDGILRAARAERDPGRRTQLYRDAERAIMDQLPVLPIAQFQIHVVVSKRVRNLKLNSLGTFDATTVSLD